MATTGNPPAHRSLWSDYSDIDLSTTGPFPIPDTSLESAFSNLSLSPAAAAQTPVITPSDLGFGDGFLQWLRVQDAVNAVSGQIDRSRGQQARNYDLAAGMIPNWSYPVAEIYRHNDLLGKQQYIGIGGNYPVHQEMAVSRSPNLRHSSTMVDPYNSGYNRPRPMDLPHMPLRYLRGRIVDLAKNQRGCRLLQANLEGPTEEDVNWILNEILYRIDEIMCDQFGNYVFQKIVKVANERQRTEIAIALSCTPFHLIAICVNQHGTRAVQKFLETINTQEQINLVMNALWPGAVTLSTDPNGHHVMQHCLKRFSFEDNKFLINEMTNHCFEISTNKSGCCVMQSCVDFSRGEYRKRLIFEIITNAVHLAEDPYGNYVVQHLLDLKTHDVTEDLLRQLEGFHVALSCNKYASNVVQKCMEETEDEHSSRVIMECLTSPHLSRLLNDPYGNYVVQTALKRFKGPILKNLLNLIRQNAASMRNNMYGKKILDLVQEMKLWRV